MKATEKQIGGNHYEMKIQPAEFIEANQIKFLEGNAIKYLCRHESKHGQEDILKAIHYCELILELRYNINANSGKTTIEGN